MLGSVYASRGEALHWAGFDELRVVGAHPLLDPRPQEPLIVRDDSCEPRSVIAEIQEGRAVDQAQVHLAPCRLKLSVLCYVEGHHPELFRLGDSLEFLSGDGFTRPFASDLGPLRVRGYAHPQLGEAAVYAVVW